MKITAERAPLADAVSWVAQAIPKNSQAPALAGMKLTAAEGSLTLQAFDYDVSHTATIGDLDVSVASEGECLVSGKFVREIVASLKGKAIELVLDNSALTISAGRASYRTRVLNLGDFPHLPKRPAEVGKISGARLAAMVASARREGSGARCVGQHELFDSTDPADHVQARALCRDCPAIDWCRAQIPPGSAFPSGTWAGRLYGSGRMDPLRLDTTCPICSEAFKPATRGNVRYCSDPCRVEGVRRSKSRSDRGRYRRHTKRAEAAA